MAKKHAWINSGASVLARLLVGLILLIALPGASNTRAQEDGQKSPSEAFASDLPFLQHPQLLKDINVRTALKPATALHDNRPYPPEDMGNLHAWSGSGLYFTADDKTLGAELWHTGSTGAVLVKDIQQGIEPQANLNSNPLWLTDVDGTLFLSAYNINTGRELWMSDGSSQGTVLVKDMFNELEDRLGQNAESPVDLIACDGLLYFGGGNQIYRSDGTESGTFSLGQYVDVVLPFWMERVPLRSACLNGQLYYKVTSGTNIAIWRTNGTTAGTKVFFTPQTPADVLALHGLTAADGSLYFFLQMASGSTDLWRSDGTGAGTVYLMAFSGQEEVTKVHVVGEQIFFLIGDRLAVIASGQYTEPGPQSIVNLMPDFSQVFYTSQTDQQSPVVLGHVTIPGNEVTPIAEFKAIHGMALYHGGAFLIARDTNEQEGLWWNDGTVEGTRMIHQFSSRPGYLTVGGDGQLYVLGDGMLWMYDRQAEALVPVGINAEGRTGTSGVNNLTVSGGKIFFTAYADNPLGEEWMREDLWVTDGTPEGTKKLLESQELSYHSLYQLIDVNGALFFVVDTQNGDALWKSDGTPEGTIQIKQAEVIEKAVSSHSKIYFSVQTGSVRSLWASDGSEQGTYEVNGNWPYSLLTATTSHLYYTDRICVYTSPFFGCWESLHAMDLTTGTTAQIESSWQDPIVFAAIGDVVYFFSSDWQRFYRTVELWRTEGTPESTVKQKEIYNNYAYSIQNPNKLVRVGEAVFFAGYDDAHGIELWKSDGTTDGTQMVVELIPGLNSSWDQITPMVSVNDVLLFMLRQNEVSTVWRSDGTPQGTYALTDAGQHTAYPSWAVTAGSRAFFTAGNPPKIWVTDGTLQGQYPIFDTYGSNDSGIKAAVIRADPLDRVFFTASNFNLGNELWVISPNSVPVVKDLHKVIYQNQPAAVPLTVSDPEGGPITITITQPPKHGSLSGIPLSPTYKPDPGYTGYDSFVYTAHDDRQTSSPALALLVVLPPGDEAVITRAEQYGYSQLWWADNYNSPQRQLFLPIPPERVQEPLATVLIRHGSPSEPPSDGMEYGGWHFTLDLLRGDEVLPGQAFEWPTWVAVTEPDNAPQSGLWNLYNGANQPLPLRMHQGGWLGYHITGADTYALWKVEGKPYYLPMIWR